MGLVIYGDLHTLTGGFLYDRRIVEYLRSRGDSVEVYSLPQQSYALSILDNLSRAFLRKLVRADIDVLVQDELNHPSLFLLNRRLRRAVQYPIVGIVHHLRSSEARPSWQNVLCSMVERRYLSTPDGFVFNSETTRRSVADLIGNKAPCVVAFPAANITAGGASPAELEERALSPGPIRVLFLGSLIPRKELHTLI
ncbi:glycosyltransferase, partial [Thermodesulfobacteriota bacterium]